MTAPVPPFRKIPIFHTFPHDFPLEELRGMTVERGRLCEQCQSRFYLQSLVTHEYLDSLRPAMSKLWVESACEPEQFRNTVRIWTPNACPVCLRKDMDTFNRDPK